MEGPKVPERRRGEVWGGMGVYSPRKIKTKISVEIAYFSAFWEAVTVSSSVGKARLGIIFILLLQFVLPPGTTRPQLRATLPPGHNKVP